MNLPNYSSVCRTCLSRNVTIKSVFHIEQIMNQEVLLSDMIMSCASVTIIKDDELPSNICSNCIYDLRKAFAFKKMCEESDTTLRSFTNHLTPTGRLDPSFDIKDIKPNVNLKEDDGSGVENEILTNNWDDNISFSEQCDDGSTEGNCEENAKGSIVKKCGDTKENNKKRKSYKCDECREECLGLAAYWKHMANIHGKNFKCDACEKEFKTQHLLKQHKTVYHKEPSPTKHKRNKTGIIKKRNLPRTCEICKKTFRFHSNLERHKLIHTGEKPYLCNVCGKGFGQMSYLKIHSFIHTGEKPYKCQMCDKSFAAPGTLMTHVRIHTGERPHVCKICGKDFPQSGYLSAHIRTHTGEKPVECPVCYRRFNQSGRLVIHMRIHSGEKPYSCKECGRCFAVRGTLKKHIRTHTGERPYVCSVCGQAFAQSGTLATHMRVHRPKQ